MRSDWSALTAIRIAIRRACAALITPYELRPFVEQFGRHRQRNLPMSDAAGGTMADSEFPGVPDLLSAYKSRYGCGQFISRHG